MSKRQSKPLPIRTIRNQQHNTSVVEQPTVQNIQAVTKTPQIALSEFEEEYKNFIAEQLQIYNDSLNNAQPEPIIENIVEQPKPAVDLEQLKNDLITCIENVFKKYITENEEINNE